MEIRAQDLRLHNWIKSPEGVEFQITSIDFDELHSNPHEYYVNSFELIRCSPIELTEEWLLEMGFKEVNGSYRKYWYLLNSNHFKIAFDEDGYYLIDEAEDVIYSAFKYLHQIQNLYFALTQTELTIKEK